MDVTYSRYYSGIFLEEPEKTTENVADVTYSRYYSGIFLKEP